MTRISAWQHDPSLDLVLERSGTERAIGGMSRWAFITGGARRWINSSRTSNRRDYAPVPRMAAASSARCCTHVSMAC